MISIQQVRAMLVGEGYAIKQIEVADIASGTITCLECQIYRANGVSNTLVGKWVDEISALRALCKWHGFDMSLIDFTKQEEGIV